MKTIFSFVFILFISSVLTAQDNKIVQAEISVSGICNMCKERIETAVKISEVRFAKWDKHQKSLKVAFLSPAVTLDSLEKRIAAVGHDTDNFKAATEVYSTLPKCCRYRDGLKTH